MRPSNIITDPIILRRIRKALIHLKRLPELVYEIERKHKIIDLCILATKNRGGFSPKDFGLPLHVLYVEAVMHADFQARSRRFQPEFCRLGWNSFGRCPFCDWVPPGEDFLTLYIDVAHFPYGEIRWDPEIDFYTYFEGVQISAREKQYQGVQLQGQVWSLTISISLQDKILKRSNLVRWDTPIFWKNLFTHLHHDCQNFRHKDPDDEDCWD